MNIHNSLLTLNQDLKPVPDLAKKWEVSPDGLSAIPSARPGIAKERILLSGDVPSPLNPPSGCRFHTRCPKAMPQCKAEEPLWKEVTNGHYTACHLY